MPDKSALVSRNINIKGRRTSIRLETQMWSAIREIAEREHCSIHDLCTLIASRRKQGLSLTASIRIFLMLYFKAACTEEGHTRAGHGGLDRMMSRIMPANGTEAMQAGPAMMDKHNGIDKSTEAA
ncbi:MAG: ribbon-helix-helix domain-containing protein [Alphaproteobacteria bacterium]|nr:ribbon-helix-helix domain-containing protein [Alphaproteobacteria bacterium]